MRIFIFIFCLIYQNICDTRCSLIFEQQNCIDNNECIWVNMQTAKVYYEGKQDILKCYNKSFVLNAMKAKLFPEKFSNKTNKDLLKKAGINEDEDYLENSKNIQILVNKLMENGFVDYIKKFEIIDQ